MTSLKEIVEKLAKAFEVAAKDTEYHKFILERSVMPFYLPPVNIIPHLDAQREVARAIMDKAGILKEK